MLDKDILTGIYDLHIHSAPDIVERKANDVQIAERAAAAGMKGYVSKSHYALTTDRAAAARKLYPNCNAMGSIVLNTTNGGINPIAAEHAARLGAKIIWFPTLDSPAEFTFMLENAPDLVDMQSKMLKRDIRISGVKALNEKGALTAEAREILAIAKDYDIAVGTGHITHEETYALAKAAADMKFGKLIITHVNLSAIRYSVEEQKALAGLGAVIERSYVFPYSGRITWEEEVSELHAVGTKYYILSTDLGRPDAPFSDEGMYDYANQLYARGIKKEELRQMMAENTARLVE